MLWFEGAKVVRDEIGLMVESVLLSGGLITGPALDPLESGELRTLREVRTDEETFQSYVKNGNVSSTSFSNKLRFI